MGGGRGLGPAVSEEDRDGKAVGGRGCSNHSRTGKRRHMKELKPINSRKSIAGTEASKGICKGNSTRDIFPSYRYNWSARVLSKLHTDTMHVSAVCTSRESKHSSHLQMQAKGVPSRVGQGEAPLHGRRPPSSRTNTVMMD